VRVATRIKDRGSRMKINTGTARPKERANTRVVPIKSIGTRRGVEIDHVFAHWLKSQ